MPPKNFPVAPIPTRSILACWLSTALYLYLSAKLCRSGGDALTLSATVTVPVLSIKMVPSFANNQWMPPRSASVGTNGGCTFQSRLQTQHVVLALLVTVEVIIHQDYGTLSSARGAINYTSSLNATAAVVARNPPGLAYATSVMIPWDNPNERATATTITQNGPNTLPTAAAN
ncbi:hypothetical protein F5887DRAFT_919055 [Amanita rubescens]|nr:hypothetical protein F5887DRAFT_919055 [Amanita rubescens]